MMPEATTKDTTSSNTTPSGCALLDRRARERVPARHGQGCGCLSRGATVSASRAGGDSPPVPSPTVLPRALLAFDVVLPVGPLHDLPARVRPRRRVLNGNPRHCHSRARCWSMVHRLVLGSASDEARSIADLCAPLGRRGVLCPTARMLGSIRCQGRSD
eukprot:5778896-Prymnesium_polylepis.2